MMMMMMMMMKLGSSKTQIGGAVTIFWSEWA